MSVKGQRIIACCFLGLLLAISGAMLWQFGVENTPKPKDEIAAALALEEMGCAVKREVRRPWFNYLLPKQFRAEGTLVVVTVEIPIESRLPNYSKRVTDELRKFDNLESVLLTGSAMTLAPPNPGTNRIDWRDLESLDVVVHSIID